ncbi:MAG: glycoside hydrolase family 127 protein [Oscillospiraceae bacterium]|nr:glycoside hydrolase family 127 protein [Oscillospiraceae bacterium]
MPITGITPEGYLRRQLEIQAQGLTGHMPDIWEDVSDNSAWLGGTGEAWERGPYFLDGLLPLGLLLGYVNGEEVKSDIVSPQIKKRIAQGIPNWVENILASQREDGFFGSPRSLDWWPRFVVLKTLVIYYKANGDKRILAFMDKFFRYIFANIDQRPLKYWASARALETGEAIELLYHETGEDYLTQLAEKLCEYMYDWNGFFSDLPYKKTVAKNMSSAVFNFFRSIGAPFDAAAKRSLKLAQPESRKSILQFNRSRLVRFIMLSHGVNIAMAFKYPAVQAHLTGADTRTISRKAYENLMKYHGLAYGMWTADEHLNGYHPYGGTELCAVAEAMYSCEELLGITGDVMWAEILEQLAYNALPATFTPDMCSHQYAQQPNQIRADVNKRPFYDLFKDANTFGLEPNYGCCAANLHQAFPKFAANACYETDRGLAFMLYMPCVVKTQGLTIREETGYPFEGTVSLEVLESDGAQREIKMRIPKGAKWELNINGNPYPVQPEKGVITVKRPWKKGERLLLKMIIAYDVAKNPDGSISVRKGTLLFALPIDGECRSLGGAAEPFHNREFIPNSQWRYAPLLTGGKLEILNETRRSVPKIPFDTTEQPLTVTVMGTEVLNWREKKNSAGPYPKEPALGNPEPITLVPYGCTNLRISQFPRIEK